MAVYLSFLRPGDKIMGMDLSHGGHLTHGSPVNFSGILFQTIFYGLDKKDQRLDYQRIHDMARQHRPKLIIAGASAYPRIIDFHRFAEIARDTGAYLMVDMAHIAGLVAADLHPSPVGQADFITSTTHKTLRGPRGGLILSRDEYGRRLDKGVFPCVQGGPLMHVIAAKAVSFREALQEDFRIYQRRVVLNAKTLAERLSGDGFDLVTGGTDNHLVLIDLRSTGITGLDAERALGEAGIAVNKNTIPFDDKGPTVTSGIRIGTPALTTRGMGESEMKMIAELIKRVIHKTGDEKVLRETRSTVADLCARFPVYHDLSG
jgi:glycine hydroxymethyltransferase